MRKNKMMRTASGLLVATLLTTCVISGTFAKYTTTASGTDSARVAKWGIQMDNTGSSTFSDTYKNDNNATTVTGKENAKVVAPGTKGSAEYKVTGAPETAYEITFEGKMDNDVFLAKGLKYSYKVAGENSKATYTSPAGTGDQAGSVTGDYYPVNYSVKIVRSVNDSSADPSLTAKDTSNTNYITALNTPQTFETLAEAMAALNNTKVTYNTPNTEAGLTVTIEWNWQFDSNSGEDAKIS